MTVADDAYEKNCQSSMYTEFRMKAAICENDSRVVTSISLEQMDSKVTKFHNKL